MADGGAGWFHDLAGIAGIEPAGISLLAIGSASFLIAKGLLGGARIKDRGRRDLAEWAGKVRQRLSQSYDRVIDWLLSGLDRWVSLRAVWRIVTMLAGRRGRKWPPRRQPRIYPRRKTG